MHPNSNSSVYLPSAVSSDQLGLAASNFPQQKNSLPLPLPLSFINFPVQTDNQGQFSDNANSFISQQQQQQIINSSIFNLQQQQSQQQQNQLNQLSHHQQQHQHQQQQLNANSGNSLNFSVSGDSSVRQGNLNMPIGFAHTHAQMQQHQQQQSLSLNQNQNQLLAQSVGLDSNSSQPPPRFDLADFPALSGNQSDPIAADKSANSHPHSHSHSLINGNVNAVNSLEFPDDSAIRRLGSAAIQAQVQTQQQQNGGQSRLNLVHHQLGQQSVGPQSLVGPSVIGGRINFPQANAATMAAAAAAAAVNGNGNAGSGVGVGMVNRKLHADRFGLTGLLSIIRMSDPDLNTLALGTDLTTLGLNLNSTEVLYSTFSYPTLDCPTRAEPDFVLPYCYYMQPPALKTSHLAKFTLETLFYIFYNMPKDTLQVYAAKELYNREWRYHKELKLWFTRTTPNPADQPDPQQSQSQPPQAAYMYFDISTWERKIFRDTQILQPHKFMTEEELQSL